MRTDPAVLVEFGAGGGAEGEEAELNAIAWIKNRCAFSCGFCQPVIILLFSDLKFVLA